MKPRINFVIEQGCDENIVFLTAEKMPDYDISTTFLIPENPIEYEIIVLWNLQCLITGIPNTRNVIVLHSSDLPKGKGWAPIYYAIAENRSEHVITAFLANAEVDGGDIVAKAKFPIHPNYTAKTLRHFDKIASVELIKSIAARFKSRPINGIRQSGESSYYKRRIPSDNIIDINIPLVSQINHLRACEDAHPGIFEWNGYDFEISIKPVHEPVFPDDLKIEFSSSTD